VAGALRQTRDIFMLQEPGPVPKRGTQAIAGVPAWTDVVFRAQVRPEAAGAVGLVFRYADAQHYYRLSLEYNEAPFPRRPIVRSLRLVKKVAGAYSLLWDGEFDFVAGQIYELAVVASGANLQGFIDGVPAFVVRDGSLANGQIGLYHWRGTNAWFSGVRVYPIELATQGRLLDERFNALVRGRWRFVDEGDRNAPSHWDAVDGTLRQTSSIAGGDPAAAAPEKPGTIALGGDSVWSDYRLTVELQTGAAGAIGVLVRYRDSDNYYRFSIDPRAGYRRFVRRMGGRTTVLWEDAVPVRTDRTLLLTLDCLESRLVGTLDGRRLFAVDDASLGSGEVGLYCWANPHARFGSVQVDAHVWDLFYRFGDEPRLSPGTRVRVYSGSPIDAPPVEPNVVRRFAAAADDPGMPRLPRDGADLRLIDGGGVIQHARTILPPNAFAPINVRLLRKSDGTAVAVVPEAAPQFDPGDYRVVMTYRRDNRANVPSSNLLSESGDRSPEHVVTDIPWQAHRV
jgi:hypothetical protein